MNKLILDGVEYNLSDSLVAKLKESVAAQSRAKTRGNPFKAVQGKSFYFINEYGAICEGEDYGAWVDETMYAIANYCHDKTMMKQRALYETLNRLLWRYSETHDGDEPWGQNMTTEHWFITTVNGDSMRIDADREINIKTPGVVYFKDRETTLSAIEEVVKPFLAKHPEFVL